jgi:hypothetical protein
MHFLVAEIPEASHFKGSMEIRFPTDQRYVILEHGPTSTAPPGVFGYACCTLSPSGSRIFFSRK